jgi:hypothetical protein
MTRVAKCQCGGFRMTVTGDPVMVNMCYCTECQRRSGMPLTVNAYFSEDVVRIEGEHKTYSRAAPEGRKLHNYFCPTCGPTVGWRADLRPGLIGVAVGSFNDKTFPKPAASIWEDSKCEWLAPPHGVVRFPRARTG